MLLPPMSVRLLSVFQSKAATVASRFAAEHPASKRSIYSRRRRSAANLPHGAQQAKLMPLPLLCVCVRPCVRVCCCTFLQIDTNTTSLHQFNGLFSRTPWVSRYQKGKTSLDLNEARDDGVLRCSGISWTICKQPAPHSRQITTPTPHHSIFYRPDSLPNTQPTVSKY